ncbi:MAG: hypothetical protein OXC91_09810 [Rhodobacteraceae bacterium]|nr:hypothetical protein [Paracoccaceae bacterium]
MNAQTATNLQSEGWASVFDLGGHGSSLVVPHAAGPGSTADSKSSFHLPADLEERFSRLAMSTGETKAFHAREALLSYLDDLEDLTLAESRLHDIRSGKTQAIPLEDVLRRHGMEG